MAFIWFHPKSKSHTVKFQSLGYISHSCIKPKELISPRMKKLNTVQQDLEIKAANPKFRTVQRIIYLFLD